MLCAEPLPARSGYGFLYKSRKCPVLQACLSEPSRAPVLISQMRKLRPRK